MRSTIRNNSMKDRNQVDSFPLYSQVIIRKQNDPLTGKTGEIRSKTSRNRGDGQNVYIKELDRIVTIDPSHLGYRQLTKPELLEIAVHYLATDIVLLSGCQDAQNSSSEEAVEAGAFTSLLLMILCDQSQHEKPITYANLELQMKRILSSKENQPIALLSSSRPLEPNQMFQIIPPRFKGTRRALIVAIRYCGLTHEVPGAWNAASSFVRYLKDVRGFQDEAMTILMDDGMHSKPTRVNMLDAFSKFSHQCQPGNAIVFYFVGNGGLIHKENESTASLRPTDFMDPGSGGAIEDDLVFRTLLAPFAKGAHVTAITDCPGTVFGLPFTFLSNLQGDTGVDSRLASFPHMDIVREHQNHKTSIQERGRTIGRSIRHERSLSLSPKRESQASPSPTYVQAPSEFLPKKAAS